ncbi:MAG TPA: Jag N-terminal domain-containing protein, partial [Limnochordia bacterium]|nr:Jag N-terminal domain-containing protein [Limnochordia bacterium]
MSGSNEAEGRGRSVEEAVNEALRQLGARREDVEVTVLEEPARPLLGLIGGRPARVRIRLRVVDAVAGDPNGTAAPSPPAEVDGNAAAPTAAKTPDQASVVDGKAESARAFLVELLRHFGLQAALEFERDGENLLFSITGEGVSALIGRHGQTLDAVQYLVNAAVNKG